MVCQLDRRLKECTRVPSIRPVAASVTENANVSETAMSRGTAWPGALGIIGFDGRLKWANDRWAKAFGHSLTALIDYPVAPFIESEDTSHLMNQLRACDAAGSRKPFELCVRCCDGTFNWLTWEAQADSQREEYLCAVRDITVERQEHLLLRSRAALDGMIAELWSCAVCTRSSNTLLQKWTDIVARRMNLAAAVICGFDGSLDLSLIRGRAYKTLQQFELPPLLEAIGKDIEQALATRMPYIIPNVSQAPVLKHHLPALDQALVRSIVVQPMWSRGELKAVLIAFCRGTSTNHMLHVLERAAGEMAIAHDRVQSENRLRESDGALQSLMQALPQAVVMLDAERRVTQLNAAAEKLMSRRHSHIVGRELPFVAERRDDYRLWFEDVLNGRSRFRFETIDGSQESSPRDLVIEGVPLRDGERETQSLMLVALDITERKALESRLDLQQTVNRALAASLSAEHAIDAVLRLACVRLGWKAGEYWSVDRDHQTLKRMALWQEADASQPIDAAEPTELSISLTPAAAQWNWSDRQPFRFAQSSADNPLQILLPASAGFEQCVAVPVHVDDELTGVMQFFTLMPTKPDEHRTDALADTAEQLGNFLQRNRVQQALSEAERAVRQSQKMEALGLLAGSIAHDFNNLLTIILGNSEFAIEQLAPEDSIHRLLSEITDAGNRAAALTKRLLAFSRKQVCEPVVLSLKLCLQDSQKLLKQLVGPQVQLSLTLAEGLGHLKADVSQIEQIFLNLAVNARDAMPNGGALDISAQNIELRTSDSVDWSGVEQGTYIQVMVRDTGCGMDQATCARIFEPFFTTKPKGMGTGMGLATVFGIVQQARGHIRVESQLGKGTTFRMLFPRVVAALTPAHIATEPQELPPGHETVLVVDDERQVRELVKSLLEVRGYTVLLAGDGATALDVFMEQSDRIDLLLTDILMPGMNGIELAARIGEFEPGMKTLFMSAFAESESSRGGLPDAAHFLQKPFTTYDLARKVRAVLDGARESRAANSLVACEV